jgi:hypothetical protein
MTTFQLIDQTPATSALGELLVRHGAVPAVGGDLLVLAPLSLQEARQRLPMLSDAERSRCLLVGLTEALDIRMPSPENLAGLLDQFLPLGVLKFGSGPQRGDVFDFIGKKSLAAAMGTPYGAMTTSRHYAGFMMQQDEDAGAFVLRYVGIAMRANAS